MRTKEIIRVEGGCVIRHVSMRRRFCRFFEDYAEASRFLDFILPVCGRTSGWDVNHTECCVECLHAARYYDPAHFRNPSRWGRRRLFSGRLRLSPGKLPAVDRFDGES